jgi:GDP-D-mannose 3',5'-epimerase
MKKILILGGGGFIGGYFSKKFYDEGHYVRTVDIKEHEYLKDFCSEFVKGDLRDPNFVSNIFRLEKDPNHSEIIYPYSHFKQPFTTIDVFDEVYQFAADMGGAGYIFSGDNDANVMHNSATINLNVLDSMVKTRTKKVFYSSSACIYPEHNQLDPNNPNCEESSAYPANPDSEYGWEKLFSERLYLSYHRNYGLDVRIGRFHNIFGPYGTFQGGKEKAPAALCRKVIQSQNNQVDVWGDGEQTRSFLFIEECFEGVIKFMESEFLGPLNIGSDEMVTINDLAKKIIEISGKEIKLQHIDGPLGVRGRNSDNNLIYDKLKWRPSKPLTYGLEKTYKWILEQL